MIEKSFYLVGLRSSPENSLSAPGVQAGQRLAGSLGFIAVSSSSREVLTRQY